MSEASLQQLTTFWIDSNLYGIDVQGVQEVTKSLPLTPVPLAPTSIAGLLNLRGQIATAIGLRQLFAMPPAADSAKESLVICRQDGCLIALVVDEIGDVIEVSPKDFEEAPQTMPESVRAYSRGVYKLEKNVLTLVDVGCVTEKFNPGKSV